MTGSSAPSAAASVRFLPIDDRVGKCLASRTKRDSPESCRARLFDAAAREVLRGADQLGSGTEGAPWPELATTGGDATVAGVVSDRDATTVGVSGRSTIGIFTPMARDT